MASLPKLASALCRCPPFSLRYYLGQALLKRGAIR